MATNVVMIEDVPGAFQEVFILGAKRSLGEASSQEMQGAIETASVLFSALGVLARFKKGRSLTRFAAAIPIPCLLLFPGLCSGQGHASPRASVIPSALTLAQATDLRMQRSPAILPEAQSIAAVRAVKSSSKLPDPVFFTNSESYTALSARPDFLLNNQGLMGTIVQTSPAVAKREKRTAVARKPSFRVGPVLLKPSGFFEGIGVWRSADLPETIATDFGEIPLNPKPAESLGSLRHSRLMLHGEAKLGGGLLVGYGETDFLSPPDSPPWRLRQAWGEYSRNGWRVLAGNAWSLLRANQRGTSSEKDLIDIDVIDPAYHVGLLGDRKRQIRIVREFGPKWQAAFSYEEGGYGIAKAVRDERRMHVEVLGLVGRSNQLGIAAAAVIHAGDRVSFLTQQFITRGAAREAVGGEASAVRAFATIEGLEAKLGRSFTVFGYGGVVYSERWAGNRVVNEWSVGASQKLWERPLGVTTFAAHYSKVERATWDSKRGELGYVMVSLRHTWPATN